MEYEKCYVYEPEASRPAKRRRIEDRGLHASWKVRHDAYQKAWAARKEKIDKRLVYVYSEAVDRVVEFLDDNVGPPASQMPAGILTTDPDASSYSAVTTALSSGRVSDYRRSFVSITASTGSNLKALLKAIIQQATARHDVLDDEDDTVPAQKKGTKLLNYDLQLLADYTIERRLDQVIIAIGETEAFDNALLSDLLEHVRCWYDRIPFILLLSVATSPESLQQRLTGDAVGCLEGHLLDIATEQSERESTLEALVDGQPALWLGADTMRMMLERQSDYIQSNDSFVRALQYADMSHYYGNALSLFLVPGLKFKDVSKDHFEALRNVDSFRTCCRELLDQGSTAELRELLDSDEKLFREVTMSITEARYKLASMMTMLHWIQELQEILQSASTPPTPFSTLYTFALSGRLTSSSSLIRTLLLTIRKSPASVLYKLVKLEPPIAQDGSLIDKEFQAEVLSIQDDLQALTSTTSPTDLRSSYDISNATLRTTVVAQKVQLSKQQATMSKSDEAYTALVKRYSDNLEGYFNAILIDPTTLLFNELVIYNLRSPLRETFAPKPRHAIERALATPHDYLDCECCDPQANGIGVAGEESTLSPSNPATAVLYQLYLESGSLINVSDLQQALSAVLGEKDGGGEEEVKALFQRSLAELRYLGLVKGTGRRVGCIGKVAWKGL